MYISEVRIQNYRTFRDVTFYLNSESNYIVGDNNIGKTNFLDLLKLTTHGYGFREKDFLDTDRPIVITFSLSGKDAGMDEEARIELRQSIKEVVPRLYNKDTGEPLPLEYMRGLFYIDYSLHDIPRLLVTEDELTAIGTLFKDYLSTGTEEIRNVETLLNEKGIKVELPDDPTRASLILVREIFGNMETGAVYGNNLKLMLAIGSHLLIKLLEKKNSKTLSFENIIVTDKEGKRYFPLIVSIDEPELHLHPYLQRAVLAFCKSILNNEEPFFLGVIKKMLHVDGLDGQMIVVTHSTDALIDDYRKIIRLYWDDKKKVQAACGVSFKFDAEIEKHLIMHFPEVKEALYAQCAIIVEGETEYGSFAYFARTLGVHFDYHGICLINARGESSISKISRLVRGFHIPAISLYDRDVIGKTSDSPYVFYTDYICYEMDVVKSCLSRGRRDLLDAVISDIEEYGDLVPAALVKKAGAKLSLSRDSYPPRKLSNINPRDRRALEFYYFAWLYGNKGVIIGRALGTHLGENEIPPAFRRVILAAAACTSAGKEQTAKKSDKKSRV